MKVGAAQLVVKSVSLLTNLYFLGQRFYLMALLKLLQEYILFKKQVDTHRTKRSVIFFVINMKYETLSPLMRFLIE